MREGRGAAGYGDESGGLRGRPGVGRYAERSAEVAQVQLGVVVGRREQERTKGLLGQHQRRCGKRLLEPLSQGQGAATPADGRGRIRAYGPVQFDQPERISRSLNEDRGARFPGRRDRLEVEQLIRFQRGQRRKVHSPAIRPEVCWDCLPGAEDHRDGVVGQSSRNEPEDVERGLVDPLRVIDHQQHRRKVGLLR